MQQEANNTQLTSMRYSFHRGTSHIKYKNVNIYILCDYAIYKILSYYTIFFKHCFSITPETASAMSIHGLSETQGAFTRPYWAQNLHAFHRESVSHYMLMDIQVKICGSNPRVLSWISATDLQ